MLVDGVHEGGVGSGKAWGLLGGKALPCLAVGSHRELQEALALGVGERGQKGVIMPDELELLHLAGAKVGKGEWADEAQAQDPLRVLRRQAEGQVAAEGLARHGKGPFGGHVVHEGQKARHQGIA